MNRLILSIVSAVLFTAIAGAAERPNFIVINIDDLGYADIGESTDVAAAHPEVIKKLEGLVAAMKDDLGLDGLARGCRELGRVKDARPLIDKDGKVRPGFEPLSNDQACDQQSCSRAF